MLCPFQLDDYPLEILQGHVVWTPHDYQWLNREMSFSWEVCGNSIRYYHSLAIYRFIYGEALPDLQKLVLVAVLVFCCRLRVLITKPLRF